MKLFLVGPATKNILNHICNKHPNSSFLFNYLDKNNAVKSKDIIKTQLFIDSGAFGAWTQGHQIDVDEYIEWLNTNDEMIYLFGQLDDIPGDRIFGATLDQVKESAQKTWDNYLYMRERVKSPEKLLYTFHVGEPLSFLKQAMEYTDSEGNHIPYIALGGMVGKPRQTRDSFLDKCFDVITNSSNPNVKVHAFGMTDMKLLEKYPITSADSTGWIMTGANGMIYSDNGSILVSEKQKFDKKHYSHWNSEVRKEWENKYSKYGFTLEELAESSDARLIFNALYMIERTSKIDKERKYKKVKKKLF